MVTLVPSFSNADFVRRLTMKKLIKVMIVDDEILAIRDLKSLIDWEGNGFVVVAEAVTAGQALELAASARPQLIFMDIRMPAMDGLEVSRRILLHNRSTKIILLTSHKDFDYAKYALEIGISGYLLKHETNAAQFVNELTKIKQVLAVEDQREQFMFQQQLREALRGKSSGQQLLELEERVKATGGNLVMMVVLTDAPFPVVPFEPLQDSTAMEVEHWSELFYHIESLEWLGSAVMANQKSVFLFASAPNSGESPIRADLYRMAAAIQSQARRDGLTVSILLSPLFKSVTGLPVYFLQMEQASAYLLRYGKESVLNLTDVIIPNVDIQEEWLEKGHVIRMLKEQFDEDRFMVQLKTIFDGIDGKRFQPELFKMICGELIRLLELWRERKGMVSYRELVSKNSLDASSWYSVLGIKQWFIEEAQRVFAYTEPSAAYSQKVKLTLRYIQDHYGEELTSDSIGEVLFISGDHLRHLFKEETGRTLADYLTGYRMEKAKELMQTGNYKIYEVAEKVGYKTSQYFSQVFKKWFGQTPQEFMESVGQG
jgi:two-component system, response regulator YesN